MTAATSASARTRRRSTTTRPAALVISVAALAIAVIDAGPAVAAVIGDAGRGGTRVSAFADHVVWSTWSPRDQRWYLTLRVNGVTRRLPVPPRRRPFDVDLGPGAHGGVAAVYSRCADDRSEGRYRERCDLYRYTLGATRAIRLRGVSKPGATSESEPTIWRRSIAFVRTADRPRTLREAYPRILRADGTKPAVELRGGTRGWFEKVGPGDYDGGYGPLDLDLRGSRLGFSWDLVPTSCTAGVQPGGLRLHAQELWIASGRKQRLVGRGCAGDPVRSFVHTTFSGGALYFSYARDEDGAYTVRWRRLDLTSGRATEAQVDFTPSDVRSVAQVGADTVYVYGRQIIRSRLSFVAGSELRGAARETPSAIRRSHDDIVTADGVLVNRVAAAQRCRSPAIQG